MLSLQTRPPKMKHQQPATLDMQLLGALTATHQRFLCSKTAVNVSTCTTEQPLHCCNAGAGKQLCQESHRVFYVHSCCKTYIHVHLMRSSSNNSHKSTNTTACATAAHKHNDVHNQAINKQQTICCKHVCADQTVQVTTACRASIVCSCH
jgi:hypothetical protein